MLLTTPHHHCHNSLAVRHFLATPPSNAAMLPRPPVIHRRQPAPHHFAAAAGDPPTRLIADKSGRFAVATLPPTLPCHHITVIAAASLVCTACLDTIYTILVLRLTSDAPLLPCCPSRCRHPVLLP
jgi:hypothetical protein